jgi:hypothetical protein
MATQARSAFVYGDSGPAKAGEELVMPDLVGCWEGTLERFDTIEPLTFAAKVALSLPLSTTYQFCYRPVGNRRYRLDLTKLQIGDSETRVVEFENRVTAVDLARATAQLRNHIALEQTIYVFFIFPVIVRQDIYAQQDVRLKGRDVLEVHGRQLVQANGTDLARMTFHSDFKRVPTDSNLQPPSTARLRNSTR